MSGVSGVSESGLRTARRTPPAALLVALVLSVVGLGASIYLTYEHFSANVTLACPATGKIDCVKVTSSHYSHVLGVPVALLGLVYFVVMLGLLALSIARPDVARLRLARLAWATVGLVSVLYLVWAELYGVGAVCLWCTGVHIVTVLVFLLVLFHDVFALPEDDGTALPG